MYRTVLISLKNEKSLHEHRDICRSHVVLVTRLNRL